MDSKALLSQSLVSGTEGKVGVNVRQLVDKMLARYASEYVTFRELLQNADDAGANTVTIDFKIPSGREHVIEEISVTNDGRVFREADWTRINTIAEGNPDESTVGMFGVGFYSVFSFAENPIIASGDRYTTFFWQEKQLTTRSDKLKEAQKSDQTSVIMPLREKWVLDVESGSQPSGSESCSNHPPLESPILLLKGSTLFEDHQQHRRHCQSQHPPISRCQEDESRLAESFSFHHQISRRLFHGHEVH